MTLTEAELSELEWHFVGCDSDTYDAMIPDLIDEVKRYRMMFKKVCESCRGEGVVIYPNTSTWNRGGISGQMMTEGVCDKCWGTGDEERKGVNLRNLSAMTYAARRVVSLATQWDGGLNTNSTPGLNEAVEKLDHAIRYGADED